MSEAAESYIEGRRRHAGRGRGSSLTLGKEMKPQDISAAIQRIVASAVALDEDLSDQEIAAKVNDEIGDRPAEETKAVTALFRDLKVSAVRELPRMRWGATMTLDDVKVARFALEAARKRPGLDEIAVRRLLSETWFHLHG